MSFQTGTITETECCRGSVILQELFSHIHHLISFTLVLGAGWTHGLEYANLHLYLYSSAMQDTKSNSFFEFFIEYDVFL